LEVKLYVGNMSYDTNEEQLRTMFSEAGTVVAVDLIKDRDTHQPKGFAFVTMSTQAEAEKAITMFNSKEVSGRPLTVNAAKPREERPAYGGGGNKGSFNKSGGHNNKRSGGMNNRY
jgi:RNA recognition motif-containing protein